MDHFNILAPLYDRLIKPANMEKLISLAELPAAGRLLDVGGGTGRVAYELRQQAGTIVVVDLSTGMLREAARKEGLNPICAYSECLPFGDGTIERAVMVDAWHHVVNQAQTAREMWRILKPGGVLVVEEPDIQKGGVKLIALVEKLALMRSHFMHAEKIRDLFVCDEAKVDIYRENNTAWVVAKKLI